MPDISVETVSAFRMIDVGAKPATHRRAIAQGSIELSSAAFTALQDRTNPKGDVLALAEVAGIMAAKRTADLIPLCHPLPLESVRLRFELLPSLRQVRAFCEATTTAKTGVEMEALSGVNGALLTIYDLSKAVNPELRILEIRLDLKEGGKSGRWEHPLAVTAPLAQAQPLSQVRAAAVTVSDRSASQQREDRSGPEMREALLGAGAEIVGSELVADEVSQIQNTLRTLISTRKPHLIITSGGTGLSPRDVTPEAVRGLGGREISGFGELLRQDGARHVVTAWLSRSLACVVEQTLIVTLPGSPKAVREGIAALLPILPHALHTLRGGDHGKKAGGR